MPVAREPESDGANIGMIWRNATWLGVIPVLLNFVAVFSTGYITRRVGTLGFGVFAVALVIVGLSLTLTDMGLRALAVRNLSQAGVGARHGLNDLLSLRLAMSGVASLLVWGIAAAAGTDSALTPVLLVSSLGIVPTALTGIYTDGLMARDQARATSAATFWSGGLLTAASVVAVALSPTAVALAASYVVGPIVNMAMLSRRSREFYGPAQFRWRPKQWRVLVARSFPFFKVGIAGVAIGRMEMPIIKFLFGYEMTGIYAAATQLADRLGSVIDNVTTAALPTLMRLKGDGSRIANVLSRILHPLLAALLAGAIMAMMGTTAAVTVVFGAKFAPGGAALAVALFTLPIAAVNALLSEGFIAYRRVPFVTATAQRGQLVIATLLPFLPMLFGLPGAPLAKLMGNLVIFAARVRASVTAFPGLWDRTHTQKLVQTTLWALAMPLILWAGHFRPIVAVLVSGGGFLCWAAATAHATGALQLLRPNNNPAAPHYSEPPDPPAVV